jgi:KUP system potassium uptake protein
MKTWMDGREILRKNIFADSLDLETFVNDVKQNPPQRVPGIAVFLGGNPRGVPKALLHNIKHNKVLHEQTIILYVKTEEIPKVSPESRVNVEYIGAGIYRIVASYGFSETADIPKMLQSLHFANLKFETMKTTYFLGREALVISGRRFMSIWRKRIFLFMSHNSLNATSFFHIPPNRVVELGSQREL